VNRRTSSIKMLSGLSPLSPFSLSFSFPPSSAPPSIRVPFEVWLWLLGAGGRRSFEIVILPVSILHKTSHQLGRSAKAGLQTPAIYPGLRHPTEITSRSTGHKERMVGKLTHSRDCPNYSDSYKGKSSPRTHPTLLHIHSRVRKRRVLGLLLSLLLDRVPRKRLGEK